MNKVIISGRWTRDPDIRYSGAGNCVARGSIAVDRRYAKDGEKSADFVNVVAFGKVAEHIEKFWHKGMKALVTGRIMTGEYTNKDGQKVYTTDVAIDEIEFCESKHSNSGDTSATTSSAEAPQVEEPSTTLNDFMNIPDGIEEELPFN